MFSALPGGMVEMVTSGRDMGADVKTLTIIHLMRVVIIVMGASVLGLYVGVEDLRMQTPSFDHAEYILMHLVLGFIGWKLFAYLKIPSAPLLGPMFLVAGLQGFDVLHLELFTPLLILAQVAIGIDIARAFCGVSIGSMRQAFFAGIFSVLIMFCVLCVCAFLVIRHCVEYPMGSDRAFVHARWTDRARSVGIRIETGSDICGDPSDFSDCTDYVLTSFVIGWA